ncbi:MAG TPA: PaaI family thioesterase, partial [Gemmatales bacterium]|nr:PaaI family thioesterase [Gemmatales bacterium]
MSDMLAMGQKILNDQPFSRLLKTEMLHFAIGEVTLKIPITPDLLQQYGFVHGGVLGYAADNALSFAGGSVLQMAIVSSEYKVNFMRPAVGEFLLAQGSVLHAGKTQAVCRADIYVSKDGVEKLCATAQGTIVKVNLEGK